MSTEEEAKAAIEQLNGEDLDGRNIVVNEARPREERGAAVMAAADAEAAVMAAVAAAVGKLLFVKSLTIMASRINSDSPF